ncbi:cysteine-rich small domain-containing protein [Methanocaldococcus sp.]
MIELAKNHLRKVLETCGANRNCKYYPCHFDEQVCLWCFCPFYPCEDYELGEYIERKDGSKIWSCSKCFWIHRIDVTVEILKEILNLTKDKEIDKGLELLNDHKLMLKIKDKVKEKYPINR